MGALRVVVYAEGAGETQGQLGIQRAPSDPILEDDLAAAHLLVRRCLVRERGLPENAIQFEEPLRTRRGGIAKGSDLQHELTLMQLLTWPPNKRRPDLAIVLVDADEEVGRAARLQQAVAQNPMPKAIGVAVPEFESWLIADQQALAKLLGAGTQNPGAPEQLTRGQAKSLLSQWAGNARLDAARARRDLANTCDLTTVATACPAFARFLAELR